MPRLVIIIPYAGNPKRLEDTLVSVLENRPEDCEVVVVLGEAYDNPYHLEDEVRFCLGAPSLGTASSRLDSSRFGAEFFGRLKDGINQVIATTRAPVVHLLACGAEVSEGWADHALEHFDDLRVATVVPLVLDSTRRDRVLAAGRDYTRSGRVRCLEQGRLYGALDCQPARVLAPHWSAAFYRKSALELVGCLSSEVGLSVVDLDLALALDYLGFHAVLDPQCRVTASSCPATSASAYQSVLEAEQLFRRWAVSPSRKGSWIGHALVAVADAFSGLRDLTIFSRLAGRLAGFFSRQESREHLARLRHLQETLSATASLPSKGQNGRRNGLSASGSRIPAVSSKTVPPAG